MIQKLWSLIFDDFHTEKQGISRLILTEFKEKYLDSKKYLEELRFFPIHTSEASN